jgi:hypothetical protein
MRFSLGLVGTILACENSRMREFDVAIVGAGIAGLAAARAIASAGKKVLLLEARQRIGGRVFTDSDLGFAFDHGAPTMAVRQTAGAVIVNGKELSKPDYEKYEKQLSEVEKKIDLVHQQLPGVDPRLALAYTDPLQVLALGEIMRRTPYIADLKPGGRYDLIDRKAVMPVETRRLFVLGVHDQRVHRDLRPGGTVHGIPEQGSSEFTAVEGEGDGKTPQTRDGNRRIAWQALDEGRGKLGQENASCAGLRGDLIGDRRSWAGERIMRLFATGAVA